MCGAWRDLDRKCLLKSGHWRAPLRTGWWDFPKRGGQCLRDPAVGERSQPTGPTREMILIYPEGALCWSCPESVRVGVGAMNKLPEGGKRASPFLSGQRHPLELGEPSTPTTEGNVGGAAGRTELGWDADS